MVEWVQQKDSNGCTVAAVAMVVGKTYDEVRSYSTIDFSVSGACIEDWCDYLFQQGFAFYKMFRVTHLQGTNKEREKWPPDPFAPIHICGVVNSVMAHAVVMLENGDVLDPAWPGIHKLTDYKSTNMVIGCWKQT